jgi:hypothetical protein
VTQLELVACVPPKRRPTIEQRFASFHAVNPHVMAEMLRLARCHLDNGATRIGAKQLWEELRLSIRVRKLGEWRLDNSLVSLYSRALLEMEPRLVGVIETRKRKAV